MRTSLVALALIAGLAAGRPSLEPIWSFLASAWSASSTDAGCGLDPNGRCNPAPQTDEGLGFDRSGTPGS